MIKKWNIKTIFKEILIGAVILMIVSNVLSYIRKPTLSSNKLPKIEAKLLDGTSYSITEGKPVIIHFWATWCPTCKLEAANIEHVSKSYQVITIAVSSGDDNKIKAYMQEKDLHFKVINDFDGIWANKFNVNAYPTTFIYDAKGELKFSEVGYTTTAGLLARLKLIQ